ncbi:hypothetical protein [Variovorax sp. OV084]|jgi:hypothetical protein|uniref:hypothetical protein n=1 Tax=Variovorax sp. OV084 TaxID=1882777 RepID=UPI0008CC0438|nr:hypothetical protein [Variovorax sp. OV084]SEU21533.1 hypothetical protein SAMN05443580_13040 [Variovorax sp. OV084]
MIDALKYFAAVASGFVFLASSCEGAEEKIPEKTTDMAFGSEFYLTNDSDNFQSRRVSVEFFPAFENADRFLGFRLGDYQYRQNNWQRAGKKISFLARSIETRTGDGGAMEAGLFEQGGHTLLTLDGSYRMSPTKSTAVEFLVTRDWVETPKSLDRGIDFSFVGVAVDQGLGSHVTLVGLLGQQFFSDSNRRDHARLRLIYQPSLDLGLTLQARYRTYRSSHEDVDRAYFNPKNYSESMLAVGWRHRFQGWTAALTAGLGNETINHDLNQPTRLLDLSLQSPVRGSQVFRFGAGYSRSTTFSGPSYTYRYLRGEWVILF